MKCVRQLVITVLLVGISLPVCAQRGEGQNRARGGFERRGGNLTPEQREERRRRFEQWRQQRGQGSAQQPGIRGNAGQGPSRRGNSLLRQFSQLSPEEQQQRLEADPKFQQLPPERQQALRNQLQKFNALSPDQREKMLDRLEKFQGLTPEQRKEATDLYRNFREMPAPQRRRMQIAFRNLMQMEPGQREQVLESDRMKRLFSDDERGMLRRMLELGPPPGGRSQRRERPDSRQEDPRDSFPPDIMPQP